MGLNFSKISNETIVGRILRLPLRLLPTGTVVPVLQGPLRGQKWIVGSSTHGCWLGTYELPKQLEFARSVKSGDVVYDIGANVGFYSLLAAVCAGGAGLVYSFEPAPRNIELLTRHLALNRVSNCEIVPAAVCAEDGWRMFDLSQGPCTGHLSSEGSIKVKAVSLDSFLRNGSGIRKPNILKIDVEGGEFEVLSGASRILSDYGPQIFLATHGPEHRSKCCELLESLSYHLEFLSDDELIARKS